MIEVPGIKIEERWDDAPDDIREAVFSPHYNDLFDKIVVNFHMAEGKQDALRKLCFLTFMGFVDIQDLYKEIKDSLQIDPRIALEIYHELDKNIFSPFKKEIEDEFIKYKIGIRKESEIFQSQPVSSEVVLKKEGPEIINLKTGAENVPQLKKLKIETDLLPTDKTKEPTPVSLGGISIAQAEASSVMPSVSKAPTQPTSQSAVLEGPFMLHKKEESQVISQTQTVKGFGKSSFGGFLGSTMKSFGAQKSQDSASTAKIEMPFDQKPLNSQETQKVPIVVKKYEQEEAKTIHYSPYKSPLEKGADGLVKTIVPSMPQQSSQQSKKPETKDEGMIDLTSLTLNK